VPLPKPSPIQLAAATPLGTSLQLNIGQLNLPGSLLVLGEDEVTAPALPPAGYKFVGDLYDLLAQNELDIGGLVRIGIEYGRLALLGIPDPANLEILRVANGQY
jgi:hypothetical protein